MPTDAPTKGLSTVDLALAGKVALITGGSRGIGRAVAARLAEEGCLIGACARTEATLMDAISSLRSRGATAEGIIADVTEPGGVERFVAEAAETLGGVDLLVANVGETVGGGLEESTPEDWARTFELNVGHASRAIRAAVPHMRQRGAGAVAIISSISGIKPSPRAQYGAAKAAEIYLAGALARELAPDRIRVNTVSPGSIIFPGGGWEAFRDREPERFAEFEHRDFPAGRLGSVEEVADVVAFVLSERANWINGVNIAVDGAQGRPSAAGY
jgi:3-oxoacyl-[acyl-carrier protein] reductase